MRDSQPHPRPRARRPGFDNPVYLSIFAGAGLTLALLGAMFSWIAAAAGVLLFLAAAGRWTWTMRDDFAFLLADADRSPDIDER